MLFRWSRIVLVLMLSSLGFLVPTSASTVADHHKAAVERVENAIVDYLEVNLLPALASQQSTSLAVVQPAPADPSTTSQDATAATDDTKLMTTLKNINSSLSTLPSDQDMQSHPAPAKSAMARLVATAASQGIDKATLHEALESLAHDSRWRILLESLLMAVPDVAVSANASTGVETGANASARVDAAGSSPRRAAARMLMAEALTGLGIGVNAGSAANKTTGTDAETTQSGAVRDAERDWRICALWSSMLVLLIAC